MSCQGGFLGNIGEFASTNERWDAYLERFEQFVSANNIKEEKKSAVLLSVIGGKTYNILHSLTSPDKPGSKSYQEIVKLLAEHFAPKPIVIAERYRFHKCVQGSDQSVNSYLAQLRELSEHCEFGDFLDSALRDQLVLGLRNEAVQKRLLSEKDLTLKKATDISIAMEIANKDVLEMGTTTKSSGAAGVHKVKSNFVNKSYQKSESVKSSASSRCWRCTRTNHGPDECFYKNSKCHACGKTGHIQSARTVCKAPKVSQDKPKNKPRRFFRRRGPVKNIHEDSEEYESSDECLDLPIKAIDRNGGHRIKPIMLSVKVNDIPLNMELDTGSVVSVIPKHLYQEKFSEIKLEKTDLTLKTYTGEIVYPVGVLQVNVNYSDNYYNELELFVVDNDNTPLFGRSWLCKIPTQWRSVKKIEVNHTERLNEMLKKHDQLFKDELGKIKDFEARVVLQDGVTPKFCRPRPWLTPYVRK